MLVVLIAGWLSYTEQMLRVFAVFAALEFLLPVERRPIKGLLKPLTFWVLAAPVTAGIMTLFPTIWGALHIRPLIAARLWLDFSPPLKVASVVVAALLGALIGDFFFYWFHRAQHQFFWRFHRVHHSVEHMGAINSYHHISEELFRTALAIVPNSLIISLDVGPTPAAIAALLAASGFYVHSNIRVHYGRVGRLVFVDNRFHRIHHSVHPHHFDKNFGAFTTIWDRLFGTAYFPESNEWPQTGLSDFAEPDSILSWLLAPLRGRSALHVQADPHGLRLSSSGD